VEGYARSIHPKLRPLVEERKLEIDDRTCTKVDFSRVWELSF